MSNRNLYTIIVVKRKKFGEEKQEVLCYVKGYEVWKHKVQNIIPEP